MAEVKPRKSAEGGSDHIQTKTKELRRVVMKSFTHETWWKTEVEIVASPVLSVHHQ